MIDRLVELINLTNAGFLTKDDTEWPDNKGSYCVLIQSHMPSGEVLDLFIYNYVSDGIFFRTEVIEGVKCPAFIDASTAHKVLGIYEKATLNYDSKWFLWDMLEGSFVGEDCKELRKALDEFEEGQSCKVL